jgi:Fic family protein
MVGWSRDDESGPDIDPHLADDALALSEYTRELIQMSLVGERADPWSPNTLLEMNGIAARSEEETAGRYRDGPCEIIGSKHVPPSHELVPRLVDELCAEVRRQLEKGNWLEASAYALWRVCWIHPFAEGNGRTARMFSYAVLSYGLLRSAQRDGERLPDLLPGARTVPEVLKINRLRYIRALEAADSAAAAGGSDCAMLGILLDRCCCRARSLMGDRAGCLMGIIGLSRPRAGCDVQAL